MSKLIFSIRRNTSESTLHLDGDGMLTYWREGDGWAMADGTTEMRLTVAQAKERWPQYADEIDEAVRGLEEG